MADIDPITREALRRASHMHGRAARNNQSPDPSAAQSNNTHSRQEHEEHTEHKKHNYEPPREHYNKTTKPLETSHGNSGLEALFKDKETSIILVLIILLMGEKGNEHLLLALIYLLT